MPAFDAEPTQDERPDHIPARFTVVAELGRGGMGVVHEVRDERGAQLALKGLKALGPRDILRLKNEFRALRDVRHPNLVSLGELFEDQGRWFFTMELVRGVDFLRWVRPTDARPSRPVGPPPRRRAATDPTVAMPLRPRAGTAPTAVHVPRARPRHGTAPEATRVPSPSPVEMTFTGDDSDALEEDDLHEPAPAHRPEPCFDEARLRAALRGIADAVATVHRAGLVHRDIKPSNLLVEPDGRVVLLDFGVAAVADRPDDEIVGTLAYMAPEQAAGHVSPEVDWYAVGVMLYRALTGRLPFAATRDGLRRKLGNQPVPPDRWVRDLPSDLVALCVGLLERFPGQRAGEAEIRTALGDARPVTGAVPTAVPFVGRDAELAKLHDLFARQRGGRARCAVVTGASGIGKTAVVRQFLRDLGAAWPDLVVLESRCDQREVVPYNALDGVVDDLVELLGREPALAEPAPAGCSELVRLFPVLAGALAKTRAATATDVPRSAAVVDRELATAALADLLSAAAAAHPVVLFLDDLHWAGPDSVALLADLLSGDAAPPVLVVATARGDAASCAAIQAIRISVDEIAVGGLSPSDVRRLLDAAAAPGLDADAIARDAGGHPMFVAELARFAAEHRTATGTLDDALWARACELAAPARRLLSAVVTAVAPLDLDAATAAAELGRDDAGRVVGELRAARLVRVNRRADADILEPYHARVAEAVASRLPRGERTGLHGRLADALADRGAGPEPLAFHLAAAGRRAEAAVHAEAAGERAADALAFERAAEWYGMALDLGDHAPAHRRTLLVARGDMLARAGRPHQAAHAYLGAAATGDLERIEAQELRRRALELLFAGGVLDEGAALADELLTELDLVLPASRGAVLARLGWHDLRLRLSRYRWKHREASEIPPIERVRMDACWSAAVGLHLVDSLRAAAYAARLQIRCLASGDPTRIARSLAASAFVAAGLGQGSRLARVEAAIARTLDETAAPEVRGYHALAAIARAFFFDNDWPRAAAQAEEAHAAWRAAGLGQGWESDAFDMFTAWSLAAAGELGRLRRHVLAVVRSAQRTGNRFRELGFRCQFPQVYLVLDRPDEAAANVEDAYASWKLPPDRDPAANPFYWTVKSRTMIALYRGDVSADADALEAQWRQVEGSLLTRVPVVALELGLWRGQWRVARAMEAPARAAELLAAAERDLRNLRRLRMPVTQLAVLHLEAAIAHARGDADHAVACLRRALSDGEAAKGNLPAAIRWQLGYLVGGDEGAALIAEARQTLERAGAVAPERFAAGWLRRR